VGTQAFKSSTLLKKLNQGLYDEVPAQLRRWNKAGGKVIQGLINRREKEIVLWQS
jgi:lysozyme